MDLVWLPAQRATDGLINPDGTARLPMNDDAGAFGNVVTLGEPTADIQIANLTPQPRSESFDSIALNEGQDIGACSHQARIVNGSNEMQGVRSRFFGQLCMHDERQQRTICERSRQRINPARWECSLAARRPGRSAQSETFGMATACRVIGESVLIGVV